MNLKKIFFVITFLAVSIGIFGMNSPITKAITTEELLAEINRLQAQIAQLQKQLAELQGKPATWCHNFNTNLRFGDSGLEVEALQIALEREGFNVSGDTKGNFGEYTALAVVSFQEKYKSEILGPWRLEHGTGFVGKTTRAKLTKLYGCGQIVAPVTSWQRTYSGSKTDEGWSVVQTSDGGYIVAGTTTSYDGDGRLGLIPDEGDVYLIKTDANGNLIWQKNYGGPEEDAGYSVLETNDGGYIIAGKTESYGAGGSDVYLIKTDTNGNMLWQKSYGGSRIDEGRSVAQTSDGGYIIVGYSDSRRINDFDVYLVKTDANGNMLWQKTYDGGFYDRGWSVAQTSDGGYIIAGESHYDVYLIKTDTNGNMLWQKSYGGSELDCADSVLETNDGGYIIVGTTSSYSSYGDLDVYFIKTDANGNMLWQKTYDGAERGTDIGRSVAQTSDGGYIIVGYTWAREAGEDVWLIKTAGE